MSFPYGPNNPHPFDDPSRQRGNPDFPGHTYFPGQEMNDPTRYENQGIAGQRQYYMDRQAEDAFRRGLNQPPVPVGGGREQIPRAFIRGSFPITVDYGLTHEQMVRKGNYSIIDPEISGKIYNKNRYWGITNVNVELIKFASDLRDEDDGIFDKWDFRPVDVPELLAFGAQYPSEQTKHWIGSTACELTHFYNSSEKRFLLLGARASRQGLRELYLSPASVPGSSWKPSVRFAVVKNDSRKC